MSPHESAEENFGNRFGSSIDLLGRGLRKNCTPPLTQTRKDERIGSGERQTAEKNGESIHGDAGTKAARATRQRRRVFLTAKYMPAKQEERGDRSYRYRTLARRPARPAEKNAVRGVQWPDPRRRSPSTPPFAPALRLSPGGDSSST